VQVGRHLQLEAVTELGALAGGAHRTPFESSACLQGHARKPSGLFHSFRRSHLRRLSRPRRAETAERDNTFGPVAKFQKGCSAEQGENLAPSFGLQFFGRVDIDGRSQVMTVTLKDVDNRDLWWVDIEPRPDARPARILARHF
jgi:hypothetical protein